GAAPPTDAGARGFCGRSVPLAGKGDLPPAGRGLAAAYGVRGPSVGRTHGRTHADALFTPCSGRVAPLFLGLTPQQPAHSLRADPVSVRGDEFAASHAPAGPRSAQVLAVVDQAFVVRGGAWVRARLANRPAGRSMRHTVLASMLEGGSSKATCMPIQRRTRATHRRTRSEFA